MGASPGNLLLIILLLGYAFKAMDKRLSKALQILLAQYTWTTCPETLNTPINLAIICEGFLPVILLLARPATLMAFSREA